MARRVTGGKVFEQMTVPSLRKRVALDQGAQKVLIAQMKNTDTETEVYTGCLKKLILMEITITFATDLGLYFPT